MTTVARLRPDQARRIALAAQGFAQPRPARVDARHLRRVLAQLAVLQIDSVNVFSRSHYLPVLARLGPYPRELLDRMTGYVSRPRARDRVMFEYWAHAASLVPVEVQPLLRWRMARADTDAWGGIQRVARENPTLVADMYRLVADRGPVVAGDSGIPRPDPRPGQMWNWHEGKTALEYLFFTGAVTTAKRVNFERFYDLAERVLPADVLAAPTPSVDDAVLGLTRLAARALGVATEADLRDYFRVSSAATRGAIDTLVATGELLPVAVDGWDAQAWRWHESRLPRTVATRALLSPFDSLIWFRPRVERLFGFHYRIEIYTAAPKRTHGYYVLPFLLGDELVGRVDLKTDRQAGLLRVHAAWVEPGYDPAWVAGELAAELRMVAGWLGMDDVVVTDRGTLAAELSTAVSATHQEELR